MLLQDMFRGGEEVVTVSPEEPLRRVAELMKERNVGAVVVTQNAKVAGMITDRDLALASMLSEASRETPVKDVMQKEVRSIWADEGVFNACQAFAGYKVRRLPVVDRDGKLVGIVSVDDLLAMLARETFNASKALEPSLSVKM